MCGDFRAIVDLFPPGLSSMGIGTGEMNNWFYTRGLLLFWIEVGKYL